MKLSIGYIAIANAFGKMLKRKTGTTTTQPTDGSLYLTYAESGREGYIRYHEEGIQMVFYYELGGGNCQLSIRIPDETEWPILLSSKDEILHFVGKTVVHDKYNSSRRYEIEGNWINIY
jgi:hypothetical protein